MEVNKIIRGDALRTLKDIPSESIDMCITSPPYWALRDYGKDTESIWDAKEDCKHEWTASKKTKINRMIGLNERKQKENLNIKSKFVKEWFRPSRFEFLKTKVTNICPVCNKKFKGKVNQKFCSIKCLNTLSNEERASISQSSNFCMKCGAWKGQLGLEPTFDLYIKHLCDIFDEVKRVLKDTGTCWVNIGDTYYTKSGASFLNDNLNSNKRIKEIGINRANSVRGRGLLKDKNLTLTPLRFAIEMQNRGWIVRNVLIWHKPNCMPSSVRDRFTVDFEYLFFFSKSKKYYFKQQREPHKVESIKRTKNKWNGHREPGSSFVGMDIKKMCHPKGRNKRCVWTIPTQSFKDAHFAVYPEKLIEIPIKAGCPKEGIVLDPFFGSGTTGLVALKQNKSFLGIEPNQEYIKIAKRRLIEFLKNG